MDFFTYVFFSEHIKLMIIKSKFLFLLSLTNPLIIKWTPLTSISHSLRLITAKCHNPVQKVANGLSFLLVSDSWAASLSVTSYHTYELGEGKPRKIMLLIMNTQEIIISCLLLCHHQESKRKLKQSNKSNHFMNIMIQIVMMAIGTRYQFSRCVAVYNLCKW